MFSKNFCQTWTATLRPPMPVLSFFSWISIKRNVFNLKRTEYFSQIHSNRWMLQNSCRQFLLVGFEFTSHNCSSTPGCILAFFSALLAQRLVSVPLCVSPYESSTPFAHRLKGCAITDIFIILCWTFVATRRLNQLIYLFRAETLNLPFRSFSLFNFSLCDSFRI